MSMNTDKLNRIPMSPITVPVYDHDEVSCDEMADWDCDNKQPGERRTCCICAGHDCEAARAEKLKRGK